MLRNTPPLLERQVAVGQSGPISKAHGPFNTHPVERFPSPHGGKAADSRFLTRTELPHQVRWGRGGPRGVPACGFAQILWAPQAPMQIPECSQVNQGRLRQPPSWSSSWMMKKESPSATNAISHRGCDFATIPSSPLSDSRHL